MKRKVISFVLSFMMVLTLTPATAFAQSPADGGGDAANAAAAKVTAALEVAEKGAGENLSVDFSVEQSAINERNVTVRIPELQNLIQSGSFDSISVDAKMSYGAQVVRNKTFTKNASDFQSGEDSFQVEFSDFGKWNVDVTFVKDGAAVFQGSKTVPVIAENYNLTVMCATMPVLILTLKAIGEDLPPGPLILAVERYWSFDWDKLPGDIFANPFWDGKGYEQASTKAYAEMLYEISPDSHFYFYFNDYWLERDLVNVLWKDSKIPEDHYSVRFVTDGTATYAAFNKVYGNEEDAAAKHNEMVDEARAAKEKCLAGEAVDLDNMKYGKLSHYAYALLDVERDAEWWVVRKSTNDTFAVKDPAFAETFGKDTRVTSNYINNLLKKVQDKGKAEVFRDLYKFDDSDFEATRKAGKKIMMILGTSKAGEEAAPLENYVRLTQAYYGKEYDYYYKGHPGYVPELNPGRKEALESLNLKILDSSIAAEIFLFFDPDIVLSGYQSSTYASAAGPQGCLYNTSKAEAEQAAIPYKDMNMIYATDMATKQVADEQTQALVKDPEHHNYFIEFSDTTEYDCGIFDADTGELYFIKDGKIIEKKTEPDVGTKVTVAGNSYKVTSNAPKTVAFVKAKSAKSAKVPATVEIEGEKYKVTSVSAKAFKGKKFKTVTIGQNVKTIKANAFNGSGAATVILKTKALKKSSVKGSLKGSKVRTVKVKVGTKKQNKSYVKKYKKIFTKKNAGKKVSVK